MFLAFFVFLFYYVWGNPQIIFFLLTAFLLNSNGKIYPNTIGDGQQNRSMKATLSVQLLLKHICKSVLSILQVSTLLFHFFLEWLMVNTKRINLNLVDTREKFFPTLVNVLQQFNCPFPQRAIINNLLEFLINTIWVVQSMI